MKPFRPSWLLPGPHLPTIWGKKVRRQPMVHDRVERLTTPDGDHITLARVGRPRPAVPHLLVFHGLEGTIGAKYAHGLLALAATRGWSGTLMLFRGCDGTLNSAPRLYHSGETSDAGFTIRHLHAESPKSPLYACGVSLGGNVLLKWLGEEGAAAAPLVQRAAAVSVPFDLALGSRFLERGFSRLYAAHFLKSLKIKALQKSAQYPGRLDTRRVMSARTFWEFDDAVTAPLHGFADAADYYSQSSSIQFLDRIAVPTLLMSARDDPFVPAEVLHRVEEIAARNRNLSIHFTDRGGHVGWIEGNWWPRRYYMEQAVMDYLSNSG